MFNFRIHFNKNHPKLINKNQIFIESGNLKFTDMGPAEREAIVSLYTYLMLCHEKSSSLTTQSFQSTSLFSEFYYENSVTHCMMKLMVDTEGTVVSACKTICRSFDENFRRYLFAELVRFVHNIPQPVENALRLIYSHLELNDKSYDDMIRDLFE